MSYQELVKKLSGRLKGIAHKLNGRYTFFNDDDLFQEAVIRLWQEFERGNLADKTDSYILQGCYYHLKNYIRKTSDKIKPASLEGLLAEDYNAEDRFPGLASVSPFDYLQARIIESDMGSMGMDSREKKILALSLQGFTVREIAFALGVSHVLVVRLRNRIRDKLRVLRDQD